MPATNPGRMSRWSGLFLVCPLHFCYGGAAMLIGAFLLALPLGVARSAGVPTIRLAALGELEVRDLRVQAGAMIDETTLVLVGSKDGPHDARPEELGPNGAIVDLPAKASRRFTNGHAGRLHSVAVAKGRIATVSTRRDPVLRVWDLKTNKTVLQMRLDNLLAGYVDGRYREGQPVVYAVAWFHKSEDYQLAIGAAEFVIMLDPARALGLSTLKTPLLTRRNTREDIIESDWDTDAPVAISPDDAWIASPVGRANVVVWSTKTAKPVAISLIPKGVDDPENWRTGGVTFAPTGTLFAWRQGSADEVPVGQAETNVPAERRGVVQIDVARQRMTPLPMGHTIYTLHCAVDPTGTWLATVGTSRPDRPRPDGVVVIGELRVYHLPSQALAFREQGDLGEFPPSWVAFSPSGKRVVAASRKGAVKWWDWVEP